MKNKLIKLAKALNLYGHNFYSSKILKIADDFDEVTMETNYDKVYSQINSFVKDLISVEELDVFAKAPLTTVGLHHITGSLKDSEVTVESNIKEISNYDNVPETISIDYRVRLKPMLISSPEYQETKMAITSVGAKNEIKASFDEGIEKSYDKHRMRTSMPKEVNVYDRRSLEEIREEDANPRSEKIKEMFKEDDPLSDRTSDTPLRQNRVYLDRSEQKTIEARFKYTTSVRITQNLQTQHGTNPRGEDDSLSFITIHYNISIPDPKKDTSRRNDLNKKHQEKMRSELNAREMALGAREEYLSYKNFIDYLSDIQNTCSDIQSPAPTTTSLDPRVKACGVIIARLNQFKDFYGITKLDNPIKEELLESISKSKSRVGIPSTGLLFENVFGDPNFEESIGLIGESRPANIPYRLN